MKLSRVERWMLSNQYRVLGLLDPKEAEGYAQLREALERGFEAEYESACEHVCTDKNGLTEAECAEVRNIIVMFQQLKRTDGQLSQSDRDGVSHRAIKFLGFDGNHESTRLAYVRYLLRKWEQPELGTGTDGLNSHCPMLETYRLMLVEWNRRQPSGERGLTMADLVAIYGAGHPSDRG